jgi:hypothetical protein
MLDKLEPVSSDEQTFRPIKELFQWPLAAALLLSALLGLAGARVFTMLKDLLGWRRDVAKDSAGLQSS